MQRKLNFVLHFLYVKIKSLMKLSKFMPMVFGLILAFFIAACSQAKSDTVR